MKVSFQLSLYLILGCIIFNQLSAQRDTVLWKQAITLSDNGDYKPAVILFTKLIALNPYDTSVYFERGRCYVSLNKFKKAKADFETVLKLDSTDSYGYTARGMLLFREKEYDRSLSDLNKAIYYDSLNSEAFNNRGAHYYFFEKNEAALSDYLNAVRIGKKENSLKSYYYSSLADAYYSLGNYTQAVIEATKSLEMNKNVKEPYETRAWSYEKLGREEEAKADLKTASKLKREKLYHGD